MQIRRKSSGSSSASLGQVLLSPLPGIPGTRYLYKLSINRFMLISILYRVKRYLGPIQLHFIKDAWTVRNEASLGSFFYLLLSEVNAIARSHVASLGGNALLCYK